MDVLAGAEFFTVEVLTFARSGDLLCAFFIEVGSRRVRLGGITRHPESWWMQQVARNATMEGTGYLNGCRYLRTIVTKGSARNFGTRWRPGV